MIRLFFALVLTLFVSACGSGSGDKVTVRDPAKYAQTPKKIQPGDSLGLSCADSFNKTTLKIRAIWSAQTKTWLVSMLERDGKGLQVSKAENLIGVPDSVESLHMNINAGQSLYARLVQIGKYEALYNDAKRTLKCGIL